MWKYHQKVQHKKVLNGSNEIFDNLSLIEKRIQDLEKRLDELEDTIDVLSDPEAIKEIKDALEDLRAGRFEIYDDVNAYMAELGSSPWNTAL